MRFVFVLGLIFSTSVFAIEERRDPVDFFEGRIRPLLANNCWSCHTNSRMGGLRLDSREEIVKGGKSGAAIVPGQPDASLLMRAVSYTDATLKMPPAGKLKAEEIETLRTWIKDGATWPQSAVTPATAKTGFQITPQQQAFWAFRPLEKLALPELKNREWAKSPIDRFILAELEKQGMAPVAPAEKRSLLRRVTFDLTGLPPTPREVADFLADGSADAFTKVVDRLIASPRFGERFGRHWLDIARYGEDDTRGSSASAYPNAWRYRDWVITAFNADMPYDFFVKAQIAGDLMEPADSTKLKPALGYFGLGPYLFEIGDPLKTIANERDVRLDGLTRGFLGLTVACSRCHDHKFDPISTKDYYGLAGVFASSEYHEYPLVPKDVVEAYNEAQKKIREQDKAVKDFRQTITDQLAEILTHQVSRYMVAAWKVMSGDDSGKTAEQAGQAGLDAETLNRWVAYLKKPQKDHPYLAAWDRLMKTKATEAEVQKAADSFQSFVLQVIVERQAVQAENKRLLAMQKPREKDPVIGPNGYRAFDPNEFQVAGTSIERDKFVLWSDLLAPKPDSFEVNSEGPGVLTYEGEALDRFLTPLWKQHLETQNAQLAELKRTAPKQFPFLMGVGEAENATDLKVQVRGNPHELGDEVPRRFLEVLSASEPVTFKKGSGRLELAEAIVNHPLAARVIVNRLWQAVFGSGIVQTANNFGQLGDRPSHPQLLDYLACRLRENHWSMKSVVREMVLSNTYQLSSAPSEKNSTVDAANRYLWRASEKRLDAESLCDAILSVSGSLDVTAGGPSADLTAKSNRRTVYGKVSRFKPDAKLSLWDFPNPSHSAERREVSNVPLQGLFFLNSDLVLAESEALSKRLEKEAGSDDAARIRRAYEVLYCRPAAEEEVQTGLAFLREPLKDSANHDVTWQRYAQVLLSANEFLFLD